jgi:hypothetical protein
MARQGQQYQDGDLLELTDCGKMSDNDCDINRPEGQQRMDERRMVKNGNLMVSYKAVVGVVMMILISIAGYMGNDIRNDIATIKEDQEEMRGMRQDITTLQDGQRDIYKILTGQKKQEEIDKSIIEALQDVSERLDVLESRIAK